MKELLEHASPTLPIYIFIDALGELQGQPYLKPSPLLLIIYVGPWSKEI
jgi:hypothetical protein